MYKQQAAAEIKRTVMTRQKAEYTHREDHKTTVVGWVRTLETAESKVRLNTRKQRRIRKHTT